MLALNFFKILPLRKSDRIFVEKKWNTKEGGITRNREWSSWRFQMPLELEFGFRPKTPRRANQKRPYIRFSTKLDPTVCGGDVIHVLQTKKRFGSPAFGRVMQIVQLASAGCWNVQKRLPISEHCEEESQHYSHSLRQVAGGKSASETPSAAFQNASSSNQRARQIKDKSKRKGGPHIFPDLQTQLCGGNS